ncbi:hypothetical protein RRG08_003066 [Elysia crispata]|uniref:Uncharacterized protein n=1 Tax=Elysia crispata TaxID=231223 RepID=A0AAE1B747_9GAST|nr:hypothetical protein RRG08_003066 [Elysia crispata]
MVDGAEKHGSSKTVHELVVQSNALRKEAKAKKRRLQDIPRQAQSNLEQAPQDIINVEQNSSVHSDVEQLDNVDDDTQSTATILPRSSPQEPRREAKKTNNKRQTPDNDILTLACKTLQSANAEDGHDIFGQNVANKLRQMTNEQQIFAEKIISDVLFEGRLGNLCWLSKLDTGGQPLRFQQAGPTNYYPHDSAVSYVHPGSSNMTETYRTYDYE